MDTDPGIDIDSLCYAAPPEADGPVEDTCGRPATTYVFLPNGIRRYVCAECAADVDRYDDDVEPHPAVAECSRCHKLTPIRHVDREKICDECRR